MFRHEERSCEYLLHVILWKGYSTPPVGVSLLRAAGASYTILVPVSIHPPAFVLS